MKRKASDSGFTLVELMVSVSVFVLVGGVSAVLLNQLITARDNQQTRINALSNLQFTITLLQQDLEQATDRVYRDRFGDRIPSFQLWNRSDSDGDIVSLVRYRERNNQRYLQRVRYRVSQNNLIRESSDVLDHASEKQWQVSILLQNVKSLITKAYVNGHWQAVWHAPEGGDRQEWAPEAVSFELVVEGLQPVEHKVTLPECCYQ